VILLHLWSSVAPQPTRRCIAWRWHITRASNQSEVRHFNRYALPGDALSRAAGHDS
jgi:hypothetical protein